MLARVQPSRLRPAVVLALAILVSSCGGAPVAVGRAEIPRDTAVVRAVQKGSVVRILGSEGAPSVGTTGEVADGLLREALRQSPWLDFAAGPVAAPSSLGEAVRVRFDAATARCEARLVDGDVLLATATTDSRPLTAAIDELAVRIRLALGDPIDEPPAPIDRIYSADFGVVAACEAGIAALHEGKFASAADALSRARRADGGSAMLLECAASAAALVGKPAEAKRTAEEALSLKSRLGPTTTHRLLRTLLLARATLEPQLASRYDEELATLAVVGMRERPFDPEPQLTAAIASNFLGRFEEARERLRSLGQRLPEHAAVHYHAGWAALGARQPAESAESFARAARSMPLQAIAVPRAIALHDLGAHDMLREYLAAMARDPAVRAGAALHEVLRMQTAHALLRSDRASAVAHAFEDLDWLAARPGTLEQRAGELAETAETLVRLGEGARLRPYLAAILDREANTPVADAAVFGLGLAECAAQKRRARSAEDNLRRRSAGYLADTLLAFGCLQEGQLGAENQALGAAAAQSSSPLVTAALVRNLRAQGREEDAARLLATMRRELTKIHLRRKLQHPLLGPELAYAWLAP